MKPLRGFGILVLTIVLAAAWGCGSTAKTEGTGEYVDDSVITTKVKAAIFNDSTLKVNEINVETFKGVVPFLASDFLRIAFLLFFPSISLVLVRTFST